MVHVNRRIPVYFGKSRTDMFDWKQVKDVLNYDYHDLQTKSELVSNIRYAISGPINIMPYNKVSENRAWVTHLWGVNFESIETDDYNELYRINGELNIELYLERQIDIFKLILETAFYAKKQEKTSKIKIHMPMIGMGQFLKALDLPERKACQLLFLEALSEILDENQENVDFILKLCIYYPNEFSDDYLERFTKLSDKYHQFQLGLGSNEGNLLNDISANYRSSKELSLIVNAWDTRSFIGNGGSKDLTVDGFIVANAGGYNNQCINTSFLHNPFFCPNVIHPKKWIIV